MKYCQPVSAYDASVGDLTFSNKKRIQFQTEGGAEMCTGSSLEQLSKLGFRLQSPHVFDGAMVAGPSIGVPCDNSLGVPWSLADLASENFSDQAKSFIGSEIIVISISHNYQSLLATKRS